MVLSLVGVLAVRERVSKMVYTASMTMKHSKKQGSRCSICPLKKGNRGVEQAVRGRKRGRVMDKDDETRRVLYEVLLEQCFEKMSEEEKAKWIRKESE